MLSINRFKDYFLKGNERSIRAKKNILAMLFIKGGSILIGLALLPMTIGYVNSEIYGIWLTLSSMVAWISFFDVGIGNGLKNRLTEALANEDYNLARKYVSTTYAILTIIFVPLMLILLPISQILNWQSILNISEESVDGLLLSVMITIIYFCLNFIFSTINVVLSSFQRQANASLRTLLQQIVSFIIIFILTKTTEGSLLYLCMALCASPLFVILLFNITLYCGQLKTVAPSMKYVDMKLAPSLFKLGVQFFIIQIAGIIQYQMTNFLIMHYFGGGEVTAYNISYRYFNVLLMVWNILTTPLWVGFTDAITKGDIRWIDNVFQKYRKTLIVFLAMGFFMLVISPWVYDIWIGDKAHVEFKISLWVFVFNIVSMYANLYVTFLNGTGVLRVQTIACCISPIVFMTTVFLLKYIGFGIESVLIASVVANFNGYLLAPYQTRSILRTYKNNI